ncbi:MAG: metallophosphoesterase [Lachnospiraceae bacterium]|nr:metallophosphoesterase [Lachnospiraceae bacterium]
MCTINHKFNKPTIFLLVMIFLFLSLVTCISYSLYTSQHALETTSYTISSPNLSAPFRIVQLTDLHNSTFGDNNCELVMQVADAAPDVILLTGDLVNDKVGEDTSVAVSLISQLKEIAPVYFSYGNQEDSMEKAGVDIRQIYTDAGAVVLEREYVDTQIRGQQVRIGGIYGYCQPDVYAQETGRQDETAFLRMFQETDRYTVLMCHMPVCWIESGSLLEYRIDCVFAGHAHGGQIRLPFIGGLWAPDQGWFPGQECGVYGTDEESWREFRENMLEWAANMKYDTSYYEAEQEYEPSYLVLSRGLGNTDRIPRFNNIPEIVVVDFIPEE